MEVTGEKWFPSHDTFIEDMGDLWGDWGVTSEVEPLRAVLLHRPGAEIEGIGDPIAYRWREAMDPHLARKQHDEMAALYRSHGVDVYYAGETRRDRPNALFVRDLMFMTREGAIIGRPAMAARRGEERYVARALAEHGVPILKTVNADGIFEGACCMWIDPETVLLGTGSRCNSSGARQVEYELRNMGVEHVIPFQIPYGQAHIDGVMNMVDRNTAMIFPWQTPYDVIAALRDRGFRILEASDIDEVKNTFALNFVALKPSTLLMPSGNPKTRTILQDAGVEVIELDVSELLKGLGGIHCMTGFLRRG
ncbi:MAG: arginine deiminase family protein [Bacillota bacterium]|jgi:N-dimethylarginine dimethylaminohydrolase